MLTEVPVLSLHLLALSCNMKFAWWLFFFMVVQFTLKEINRS